MPQAIMHPGDVAEGLLFLNIKSPDFRLVIDVDSFQLVHLLLHLLHSVF